MIEYAREQTTERQLSERLEFHVMDALRMLEFPADSFDLVNMRFGSSFLRTWDWPRIITELARVTRPGGIIRITDTEMMHQSTSSTYRQFSTMFICALFRAGHLFEEKTTGISAHIAPLLAQYGGGKVQSKDSALEYRAGTTAIHTYYEDMRHAFSTLHPFIQKWGCLSEDYDAICQQALAQMQQSDFHATWNLLTAWCTKGEE
jgi:ubiquinone/menaquinone biosynthesis C-methylase UbiE